MRQLKFELFNPDARVRAHGIASRWGAPRVFRYTQGVVVYGIDQIRCTAHPISHDAIMLVCIFFSVRNRYRTAKERHAHTHISRTSTIVFIIRLGRHHSVSAGTSSSSCVTVQEFHKRAKQIAAPAILPFDTNLFGKMPCIS